MTLLLALACAGSGADAPADDTASTDTSAPAGPAALTDASNYTYTMALDIGATPIAVSADAGLDWSLLTTDLRGNAVDPTRDITGVDLVWFRDLTPDEVEAGIVAGSITQASVGLVAMGLPDPGSATMPLSRFDLYGTPFDPEEYMVQEGGSWLVRFSTAGNSEAMAHFLLPGEGPNVVAITDTSADLDFAADLVSLAPVQLGDDLTVDWSGLTRDGRGGALDPLAIQELWIARYDGYGVTTLQSRFFELETLAANTWTLNVYGEESATLTDALDGGGVAFTGLEGDATTTWILALRCLVCTTPAPLYLTVLTR